MMVAEIRAALKVEPWLEAYIEPGDDFLFPIPLVAAEGQVRDGARTRVFANPANRHGEQRRHVVGCQPPIVHEARIHGLV